jgi:transcriptional regulator GlxA family with amidase domain
MHIQIIAYDGFREGHALDPLDVLRRAAIAGGPFRVELVRLSGGTVTSANGMQLHVPTRMESGDGPALVVVPGADWLVEGVRSEWARAQRARIAGSIATLYRGGSALAAVGTAALILAEAGLLRGRACTGDRLARDELHAAGAHLVAAPVVDDGDIISAAGATAGLDLGFWLVERFAGHALAGSVAEQLEYEPRPSVWRRPA